MRLTSFFLVVDKRCGPYGSPLTRRPPACKSLSPVVPPFTFPPVPPDKRPLSA